jgi:hypothetical protein
MSIYDFTRFKSSRFGESITYTQTGEAAKTVKAVVFRHGAKQINARDGATINFHPIVVEIDRVDIPVVTEMKDTITCNDINGTSKTFAVRKIIYSDEGCFKVGL